jgi:hypothetical protein
MNRDCKHIQPYYASSVFPVTIMNTQVKQHGLEYLLIGVSICDPKHFGRSQSSSARPIFMNDSSDESVDGNSRTLNDSGGEYRFDLPIEPNYRERPPKGSWEAGYRLSLLALEMVKDRPEIFARRDERMCSVEFRM